jgi:hypothetical protein
VRLLANMIAVGGCVVAGVVVVVLAGYHDIRRSPWMPLGIALVAFGAVGVLIMTVAKAYRVEHEAAKTRRR